VVAHVGESDTGGKAVDAADGGVECGLADAIAGAGREHARGAEGLRRAHVDVRVVADAVAHRLVEQAGFIAVGSVSRDGGTGEVTDSRMIAVDIFAGIGVEAAERIGEKVGHACSLASRVGLANAVASRFHRGREYWITRFRG